MARWDSEIQLQIKTEGIDENGYPETITTTSSTIFANKKSVRSSEFYLASQVGKAVQVMFEVYTADFDEDVTDVLFENKTYEVVRTYINGDKTEIICTSGSSARQSGSR